MLGKGEAVGDLQPVLHHQAQEHALHHLAALTLLLVVLDDLHHHLQSNGTYGEQQEIWSLLMGCRGERGAEMMQTVHFKKLNDNDKHESSDINVHDMRHVMFITGSCHSYIDPFKQSADE